MLILQFIYTPTNLKDQCDYKLQIRILQTRFDSQDFMKQQEPFQQSIFKFKKGKLDKKNSLLNKRLNIIHVEDKNNIVKCLQSENEPTVTIAQNPLSLESCVSYFEVQVLGVGDEDTINIGLMTKEGNMKQILGKSANSFGYLKGDLLMDKKKVSLVTLPQKLKISDRIGLGINCQNRTFYVVKNEVIVLSGITIPLLWNEFYPAVSLSSKNEKVQFFFQHQQFRFDLEKHSKQVQSSLRKQIQQSSNFSNSQIYSLVHEYLMFNNYSQTMKLMQSKGIEFHKLNKYTHHPGSKTSIDLNPKQKKMVDEDSERPLKIRSRLMSQRLNDNDQGEFLEVRRKNTQMVVQSSQEVNHPRKFSLISNLSNPSMAMNIPRSEQIEECLQEQQLLLQQQILNVNQQFLETERYKIIELIKNKNVEEAIAVIKEKIPEFLKEKAIDALFKAHVFLKKIKEQSNLSAINYSKQEGSSIKDNFSIQCPFWNSSSSKIQWKQLNTIFIALSSNVSSPSKPSRSCLDLVSNQQFQIFADYINKLLLSKMGYLGCSRLSFYINHMQKTKQKLKEFKGMACGIKLTI